VKKLAILAALAIPSISARAEVIASAPNTAGGEIMLTDTPCYPWMRPPYTRWKSLGRHPDGRSFEGCYAFESPLVVIHYKDRAYTFPQSDFTLTDAGRRLRDAAPNDPKPIDDPRPSEKTR
jgi:hypothetical protein